MHRSCVLAGVVAAGCLLSNPAAAADGPDPPPDPPPPPFAVPPAPRVLAPRARVWTTSADDDEEAVRGRWYGWQLCLGYALSDLSLVVSVGSANGGGGSSAVFGVAGLAGHALTGPILHWSHGHALRGFASLGLNIGATGLGALSGGAVAFGSSSDDFSRGLAGAAGAVIGGSIGLFVANVVDAAALAYDDGKPPGVVGSLRLAPLVASRAGGLTVAGAF